MENVEHLGGSPSDGNYRNMVIGGAIDGAIINFDGPMGTSDEQNALKDYKCPDGFIAGDVRGAARGFNYGADINKPEENELYTLFSDPDKVKCWTAISSDCWAQLKSSP